MNSFPGSNGKNHELMKKLFFFIAIAVFTAMVGVANNIQIRKVLSGKERDSIEIFELPGFGLSANLAGDSVMLLDFEDLPIIHIPAKADARQIIVCDSTIYGAVDNAIYADTCSVPVMILDNQEFRIYPATTETFYVCTSDSTWSSLMLVNPKVGLYSEVTAIDRPIDQVVANDEHTFAIAYQSAEVGGEWQAQVFDHFFCYIRVGGGSELCHIGVGHHEAFHVGNVGLQYHAINL